MLLMAKNLEDALFETLPAIDRYITKKTNKFYTTDQEKLDFRLSLAVNLLGNLATDEAKHDPLLLQSFVGQCIKNLIAWTEDRINLLNEKKEIH
jgi:hypothetical protein